MEKQTVTVSKDFDEGVLPRWARRHPEVVELARRDLAYRCDVCSATTRQYRRFLVRRAERAAR